MGKVATGTFNTYRAVADFQRAKEIANTTSPFTIEVRFLGGLTANQQDAFAAAADRWAKVIVGDLDTAVVGDDIIDDLLIEAEGVTIDGPGGILGMAGPTDFRDGNAQFGPRLPVKGVMRFDSADLTKMETEGTLVDVITHEMGHVLGVGTLWKPFGLLTGAGGNNPTFTGPQAQAEFATLVSEDQPVPVPVANFGGPGTRDSHWREAVFVSELMSPFISGSNNPLSRLTAASLGDLGYQVDLNGAEPYALPNLLQIARSGGLLPHTAPIGDGIMLPAVPTQLPAATP
ncbi:leishmanolysin-related zinc metalloendopeptidase [Streptomyces sp. SP17KL33]|uniref:leishmanolysin-related zinc metalloendopeptidase n=1 Tax=Streptomyces sp. SP17KL33 TaxID=3002534 RepID=UPI002E78EAC5|nr:leishmanolysin-related zinc metalloendopeptidase [Streptomyces sp. SP17KL33]MEE1829417.1 leishmanolysin-related zinc metalloendopeptidase [Streptomyces sp. SP17KL33]